MNIDGKALSTQIRAELKEKVELFKNSYGFAPGLAVILVGTDPASQVYVRNKHRACEELGMTSFEYTLPEDTKEEELIALLNKLNADNAVKKRCNPVGIVVIQIKCVMFHVPHLAIILSQDEKKEHGIFRFRHGQIRFFHFSKNIVSWSMSWLK